MIVNATIAFLGLPKEEFKQLAIGVIDRWNKNIPHEKHVNDRILLFGTVGGKEMNQLAFVTPEDEKSMDELVQKYLSGDYKSPDKELDISYLLG